MAPLARSCARGGEGSYPRISTLPGLALHCTRTIFEGVEVVGELKSLFPRIESLGGFG